MLVSFLINILIVGATVGIHFEMLNWLSIKVPAMTVRNRARVLIAPDRRDICARG